MKVRTFIAVDVNDAVRDVSQQVIEKLMKRGFKASWVSRENVHLTLFFLGEVEANRVAQVAEHISHRVRGFPSFSFIVEKVGCFSRNNQPRVVWLGVRTNQLLRRLYEEVKAELVKHNFGFEEKFSPHITIGRIKDFPIAWQPLIEDISYDPITVAVDRITVYSSTLTPKGSVYRKVFECLFEGGLIRHG